MSILGLFDIGRSGVTANQTALAVTSNNISNVNTPGYSRQDVVMNIARPVEIGGSFIGRGVGELQIRRTFNDFTFYQTVSQSSNFGSADSIESGMSHVEQIFNETQEIGLLNYLQEYFHAWQDLSNNPEGTAQRTTLIRKAEAFVNVTKQIENDLENTLSFINDEVGDIVSQVNVLTRNIATSNGKIIEIEVGGGEAANAFRDEREKLMKELAELIDYDWTENADGAVTIVAARRSLVADVNSFDLTTALTLDGDRDIFSDTTNVTNYINSGKLGGYLDVKDDIKNNVLNDLRKLSAAITNDTNILHYEGYGLDNTTNADFFAPLTVYTRDDTTGGSAASVTSATINPDPTAAVNRTQLTFDEYDITFINAGADYEVRNHMTGALIKTAAYAPAGTTISFDGIDIDIAGAAVVGDSFFISPIKNAIHDFDIITEAVKIAASDASTLVPGDNYSNNIQANEIINKYQDSIATLNNDTYEEFYAGIVSNTGGLGKASKDNLEFEGNLLFELENRRESESGVSLDEEAANLIRYQRAFEASARLIQIADELLEVVINL